MRWVPPSVHSLSFRELEEGAVYAWGMGGREQVVPSSS